MSMEPLKERRTVLRQVLGLAGLGAASLVLGSQGRANAAPAVYTCCVVSTCDHTSCGTQQDLYRCDPSDACGGSYFCRCFNKSKPNCFQLAC